MPRRQALSSDAITGLRIGISGAGKLWDGPVTILQTINRARVPSLCDGWQDQIAQHLGLSLSAHDVTWLEHVICTYVVERVACTESISWEGLLNRLERVAEISKLIDELDDGSAAAAAMWQRIGIAYAPFKPANIVQKEVRQFTECAKAALAKAKTDKASGKGRSHSAAWCNLVYSLYDMFRQKVSRPTVTHNSRGANPKPSAFVDFVWIAMTTAVPATLREHVQSKSAMAKAITVALANAPVGLRDDSTKFDEK
jgi:hypothetical protein